MSANSISSPSRAGPARTSPSERTVSGHLHHAPAVSGCLEALGPVRVELRVRASGCYLAVGAVTSGSAALPGSLSSAAVIGFGRVGRMGGCDGLRRPVLGCAASVDGSPRADSPRDGRADRPPLPWCAARVAARSSPDASLPFASNVPAARLAKVVVLAR